jgi:MFS family permease
VLTIWQLYAVGFVVGCLTVFFDVAYMSYLPSVVERDELLEGNAKLEISRSGAFVAGPGMAGVLIGALTAPIAITLTTVGYLASGALLWRIRKPEPEPEHQRRKANGESTTSMRTEIVEGLRYVVGQPYLRATAMATGMSNFFGNVAFAIALLYVVRELGLGAEQIGIAFSIGAVGFLAGAILANRIGRRLGVGPTIVVSTLVFGPAALPIALATPDMAMPALALAGLLQGFGGAVYNVNQVSLRQAITPLRLQGRMNASMRFIVWGAIPLGATLGGILGSIIGLNATIWVGAIGGLFAFVPVLLSPVRKVRELPTEEAGTSSPATELGDEASDHRPVAASGPEPVS